MTVVSSRHDVVKELMKAFGLNSSEVYAFNLNIEAGEVVRVSVQFYGTDKYLGRVPMLIKRFELIESEEDDQ